MEEASWRLLHRLYYDSVRCSKGATSCLLPGSEAGWMFLQPFRSSSRRWSNAQPIRWARWRSRNSYSSWYQCFGPASLLLHLLERRKYPTPTVHPPWPKPGQWSCAGDALGYEPVIGRRSPETHRSNKRRKGDGKQSFAASLVSSMVCANAVGYPDAGTNSSIIYWMWWWWGYIRELGYFRDFWGCRWGAEIIIIIAIYYVDINYVW